MTKYYNSFRLFEFRRTELAANWVKEDDGHWPPFQRFSCCSDNRHSTKQAAIRTEAQRHPETLSEAESTKIPTFHRERLHVVCATVVISCSKGDEREQKSCPS